MQSEKVISTVPRASKVRCVRACVQQQSTWSSTFVVTPEFCQHYTPE